MSFDFNTTVFFGDSLTDDGNLFELTSAIATVGVPVEAAGYNQRFSNGLVYAEYSADLLGVATELNFGIGAARALDELTLRDLVDGNGVEDFLTVPLDDPALDFDINLAAQIDRYLAETANQDRATSSATLFIGANDYLNFDPSSPDALVIEGLALMRQITDAIEVAARRLVDAGVGQVVINALPSGEYFPAVRTNPLLAPVADLVLSLHNNRLQATVEELQSEGVNAVFIDIQAMTQSIVDDPQNFGITAPIDEFLVLDDDPDNPVLNPALDGVSLNQVAFIDAVHPTDTIHGVLGSFHAASLTHDVTIGSGIGSLRFLGEAEDLALAGGGADILALRGGDDIAFGEAGDDRVIGGQGMDILSGGADNDQVIGGADDDVLTGGTGDDVTRGGRGDDVHIDHLGSDTHLGGFGNDTFIWRQETLLGGETGVDSNAFDGGFGDDLFVMLFETQSDLDAFNTSSGQLGQTQALADLGIALDSIEDIAAVVDPEAELLMAQLGDLARLQEADLWALV
ncbi:SGNH/GDSL hydrolase family protein [Dinoroseobacter sp. S124A]|uniref:SGNH/GDSL hydrolase family protein n=1 Tax=Dinoroseobacter sp. S124A TaxID=3415128 RepID=UPI003C7BF351